MCRLLHKLGQGLDPKVDLAPKFRRAMEKMDVDKAIADFQNHRASPYKGLIWDKSARKWKVQFKKAVLGWFESDEEGARAYDNTARYALLSRKMK